MQSLAQRIKMTEQKKQLIIGLGYRSGVGKSTIAQYMADRHAFVRRSIAQSLKDTASCLLGHPCDANFKSGWLVRSSGREFLQKLAEFVRDELGDDYFVTQLRLQEILEASPRIVIDDVRFASEVKYIKSLGGFCFEVIRPNLIHSSRDRETSSCWTGSSSPWDAQISNIDIAFAAEQILCVVRGETLAPINESKVDDIVVSALRPVRVHGQPSPVSSLVSLPA